MTLESRGKFGHAVAVHILVELTRGAKVLLRQAAAVS